MGKGKQQADLLKQNEELKNLIHTVVNINNFVV